MQTLKLNLIAAWFGILLGFGSGLVLGLFFHREDWMGGYTSFKRRLYRLAHISFFGLAAVNLFFYLTALRLPASGPAIVIASWSLIIGAISMPICCLLLAHFPRTRLLFSVPVTSLLLGGTLTLATLVRVANPDFQPAANDSSHFTHPSSEVLLMKEDQVLKTNR